MSQANYSTTVGQMSKALATIVWFPPSNDDNLKTLGFGSTKLFNCDWLTIRFYAIKLHWCNYHGSINSSLSRFVSWFRYEGCCCKTPISFKCYKARPIWMASNWRTSKLNTYEYVLLASRIKIISWTIIIATFRFFIASLIIRFRH